MTREVYCYVTNTLSDSLNLSSQDLWDGEFNKGGTAPIQTIPANCSNQLVFYAHKTTGSMVGVTGNVIYNLPDSSQLVFLFQNPYSQNDIDAGSICLLYAGIMNIPTTVGATNYYVNCTVNICNDDGTDCSSMNPASAVNNDVINAYITISAYTPPASTN